MSNPANRLPPEYDEMQPRDYDPEFTADISTKMRIPERLAAINGMLEGTKVEDIQHDDLHRTARMNVPQKLILTGMDRSEGFQGPPDLHLDASAFQDMSYVPVSLSTPPRVLTMDEVQFRREDLKRKQEDEDFLMSEAHLMTQNGYIQHTPKQTSDDSLHRQALMATPGDHLLISDQQEDELTQLKRQMAKLSYHVQQLKHDNAKRDQRELILYPVMLGYLLFQVAKWFLSNK